METDYWDEVSRAEYERRKRREFNQEKTFVSALAICDNNGKQIPLYIKWIDGTKYKIDNILDMKPTGSIMFGGRTMKYTVEIKKKKAYIYYDNKHWYVYKKLEN